MGPDDDTCYKPFTMPLGHPSRQLSFVTCRQNGTFGAVFRLYPSKRDSMDNYGGEVWRLSLVSANIKFTVSFSSVIHRMLD